jgi:hypothetical protein
MPDQNTANNQGESPSDPQLGRPEKLAELLHDGAFLTTLRNADIIFGSDEGTGNVFLMYGKRLLERIVWTSKSDSATIATVPIQQATTELEALIVAVIGVKGRCDYNGGDTKRVVIPITEGNLL